ncbi:hypothetical protein KZ810_16845 [Sphingomonas sp. RHCKR47]|uniref:hypothetical protein n=1 Tax=Sphingomonas citricola TaxID=2862498 RepID=UPI001CA5C3E7|nr:hypothetical protein [Sphingomonas citricola]MBW6525164.1 hypothetical protein [Sphingomonas citricola]
MSRAYEEAMERRRDAYVAQALGISVDTLDDYPFDLDENASDDGVVYGWRILWNGEAPPGVDANGTSGLLWSDIPAALDEPDEDDRDA